MSEHEEVVEREYNINCYVKVIPHSKLRNDGSREEGKAVLLLIREETNGAIQFLNSHIENLSFVNQEGEPLSGEHVCIVHTPVNKSCRISFQGPNRFTEKYNFFVMSDEVSKILERLNGNPVTIGVVPHAQEEDFSV